MVAPSPAARRRLLVISHPASTTANQIVYEAMEGLGWEVHLVLPRRWVDDFDGRPYDTELLPALRARARRLPVALAGRPQRHLYLARPSAVIRQVRPAVAFVEQEPFSAAAWQWGGALRRHQVPFALQHAENLERRLPAPARFFQARTLPHAALVAARSPRAAELIKGVPAVVVPHPVVEWEHPAPTADSGSFVVGYAGRLVEAKGVLDLLSAVEGLPEARLLVVGDGPLRPAVAEMAARTGRVELLTGVRHAAMPAAYARMDVLALPSLTTPTWAEQFGRVLVEALWCGVPLVGSDSGEIPWVINSTGGGVVFPEGDVPALTRALESLRVDPERRLRLARDGQQRVLEQYSIAANARQMDSLLGALADGVAPISGD